MQEELNDDPDLAYLAAMRILKLRFNSVAELTRKLARKRFSPEAISTTLERLYREKWLDDERFAGALVRSRILRGRSRMRIRSELSAAGVEKDQAGRALEENLDPEKEFETLKSLCTKRARIMAHRLGADFLSTSEGRNKLTIYLLRQGYSAALVQRAIKEIRVADD